LSQFKKYHPSGKLKFSYLVIFQSLKLRILKKKIFVSLKVNFTLNTLDCYGLSACSSAGSSAGTYPIDRELKARLFDRGPRAADPAAVPLRRRRQGRNNKRLSSS